MEEGEYFCGPDSPFARSAYIDARGKFDKLVRGEEDPVQVYDTRAGQLRFMPPTEIAAINEDTPGTILPASAAPTKVTDTGAMKALKEKIRIISPVEKISFKDISLKNEKNGKPYIDLSYRAQKYLKKSTPNGCKTIINVSISDEKDYVISNVIISFQKK